MPFDGFICETTDEPVSASYCLDCARDGAPGCPMTAPVVKGILDGLRPDDFGLTVTTLLACPRKEQLKQEWPYHLRPSESWWAYRGQLMHNIAFDFAKEDEQAIAETRFSVLVKTVSGESISISGQPDLVLVDRAHMVDYKTTKRVPRPWLTFTCPETGNLIREGQWAPRGTTIPCPHCNLGEHSKRKVKTTNPPRAYRRHIQQTSLYRLLLWENGIQVNSTEIVYQDMAEQVRIPIDMLSISQARSLLESRVALHTQDDLPGLLTDPREVWECEWCPLRTKCEDLHGGLVGKVALEAEEAAQSS
jgi:CRISPR/Cas system-associated exonuclease Cas4 (RecB family)